MLLPDDVRTKAHKKVHANIRTLLAGQPVAFDIPLHPPTGAAVAADVVAATQFVRAWENHPFVSWQTRNLTRFGLGSQTLPTRFCTPDNDALIATAGLEQELARLRAALDTLAGTAPDSRAAIIQQLPLWRDLALADLQHARQVTQWCVDHPDSGLLPRAVAVDGVHSKWLEQHRALIEHLVAIARGDTSGARADLGLAAAPLTIRVRCSPGCGPAGLDDVEMPTHALGAALSGAKHPITAALIVENKETFLAIPPTPGTCVIFGGGYRAHTATRLSAIAALDVYYWGDLDFDGFRILDAVRHECPGVRSILMDEDTVTTYLTLATADTTFRPATLTHLTADETAALNLLITHGHLRIEQERINFDAACAALAAAGLATQ